MCRAAPSAARSSSISLAAGTVKRTTMKRSPTAHLQIGGIDVQRAERCHSRVHHLPRCRTGEQSPDLEFHTVRRHARESRFATADPLPAQPQMRDNLIVTSSLTSSAGGSLRRRKAGHHGCQVVDRLATS